MFVLATKSRLSTLHTSFIAELMDEKIPEYACTHVQLNKITLCWCSLKGTHCDEITIHVNHGYSRGRLMSTNGH